MVIVPVWIILFSMISNSIHFPANDITLSFFVDEKDSIVCMLVCVYTPTFNVFIHSSVDQ